MREMIQAKKVLRILKKNRYDAYIVGGAVRDFVMRLPISDVDITTRAYPTQVMKMFTSKPTGFKYGTVTIEFEGFSYQVTTFRSDQPSSDYRHPEEVIYADNVIEDLARRDFTINALLMDENGKIIDHIGGMDDIHAKKIRAIGNPGERFSEDALRILRAFYFQSKLGFEIEEETKKAIQEQRNLIEHVSKERILEELIKILKGKHLKMAFLSMLETKVARTLKGLEQAIKWTVNELEEAPFVDVFFAMAEALTPNMVQEYPFSNKHKHKYKTAAQLANTHHIFDDLTLYTYGLELCLLANKINYMLKRTPYQKSKITRDFEQLPVKSEMDLALRSDEIIALLNKKPGAWLGKLQQQMIEQIVFKKLKNDKASLIAYAQSEGVKNGWN